MSEYPTNTYQWIGGVTYRLWTIYGPGGFAYSEWRVQR